MFDLIFSFVGLIILSPFFIIIALIIVIDSRGGVFYKQVRVGQGGSDFKLFKFRSMATNSDKGSLLTVGGRDSRITRVGYFIRKYKIDELPQLINVLIGDMSLVGPPPRLEADFSEGFSDLRPGMVWIAVDEYTDAKGYGQSIFATVKLYARLIAHGVLDLLFVRR